MAGPLGKLAVVPGIAAAQASPGRRAR
jgi:hypothetical protein